MPIGAWDSKRPSSWRGLAERLSLQHSKIDILVNNAGVYRAGLEKTEDGFEMTMAVNHLSHYFLTHLLLPHLPAAGGRVINVSSEAHRGPDQALLG